ncbi:small-conductance mechanosensitive channel [Catenovulum agarivorans DS-2]|uniref:Small-conductance mechanosensitive channel n=1 Tax=Catenovulum agarivorans DS-2 TaxID=1328313 RepID=W7QPE5_9ALTE|nr:mechanosensitive ion channel family protein [Catenovulum agarivorans]EWH10857.1 small-conductance mechanosensitive channel [Catenovulum agarivorans DS-2]
MELINVEKFWSLINERIDVWIETAIKNLPNLAVAVFVVLCFAVLSKLVGKYSNKLLRQVLESRQTADLLSAIIKVCVLIAGIFISLDLIGLKGTVTSLLAGAGIIGLAIGFAFQDMTENLIAGIAMGIRKPFLVGDIIETDSVFGTVKAINLRNTLVETFFGQLEVVPNKILFRNILTNYTVLGQRRIEVEVGISYADDPEEAREVIVKALNKFDFVINKDETDVYAKGFGDSSVNLLVWFWIEYPGETGFMVARHKAITAIRKALAQADILIPFPIRTLDFGIKGGEKLEAMLSHRADNSKPQENKPHSEEVS